MDTARLLKRAEVAQATARFSTGSGSASELWGDHAFLISVQVLFGKMSYELTGSEHEVPSTASQLPRGSVSLFAFFATPSGEVSGKPLQERFLPSCTRVDSVLGR